MPELPEVETIRMGLAPHIVGQTATGVTVWGERTARNQPGGPAALEDAIRGRRVETLARRGKFLWAELDSGRGLVFHLGMSGQLRLSDGDRPRFRHGACQNRFEQWPGAFVCRSAHLRAN